MKIRNRFLIKQIARLVAFASRVLFWTCRVRVIEQAPRISPYAPTGGERYIYCNWHDGILGALFCGPVLTMAALASRHADGEYVADVMQVLGIHPIRGSSNRGGATAIKQMLESARELHVTIATDGPRGPRRVVKPGIVFLASHAGRRIVPVAFAAENAWRPKGKWTDLTVPKPFSTVYALGGVPMEIPPGLSREELAPYRDALQGRMDALQDEADRLAGLIPNADSDQAPRSEPRAA
jgi:lysophospholipid acyltransferase (LPLAT)-like uncharacterized protein